MRKLFIGIVILALFTGVAGAVKVTVEIRRTSFSPSEQAFKDIYGGGPMWGGEISVNVWKRLEVWISGSHFTQTGELTFTQEETKLEITPIGAGVKYSYPIEKIVEIYGGVGANHYSYKEENPIGKVSKGGLGFIMKAGILGNIFKGVVIDAFFNYTHCKMKPADFDINIGGTEVGVGLGYRF